MATKSPPKKVVTPKAGEPKQVDPQATLSALAQEIMCGKTDILAVKATFVALTIIDGKVAEVPMGNLQAPVRENKTGSRGVHLNGKLNDPTALGTANGIKYQIGANITACHSKTW